MLFSTPPEQNDADEKWIYVNESGKWISFFADMQKFNSNVMSF